MSETSDEGLGPSRCYAVGDRLAFRCGGYSPYWEIAKIEKITPSGRMKVGRWELNPDLTVRGRTGYHGPYKGEPVTDDIRNEIKRMKNLSLLRDVEWNELSDEQLSEVVRIIQSA